MREFLSFLLWFFIILFAVRLLWRLVAPFVIRAVLNRLRRKMEDEYLKRENAFRNTTDPNYAEELTLNRNLKVKVPRKQKGTNRQEWEAQIEEVEFEEAPQPRQNP
jgi:hypothetical protein